MEAELKQAAPSASPARPAARPMRRQPMFSLDEAHRALPYVSRIARDAAHAFKTANAARSALRTTSDAMLRQTLSERRDQALRRLNSAIDDLNAVGVNLRDLSCGLLCIPSEVDGKSASLLWRLGEPVSSAWSNLRE